VLARQPTGTSDWPLALALAAAVAFVVANSLPLMELSAFGRSGSTTIAGAAWQMWLQGELLTGALVAVCAVIAPGAYLLSLMVLLVALRRSPAPKWTRTLMSSIHLVQMWSMPEVVMLGILVASSRIAQVASITAGFGLVALGAVVLLLPAIVQKFDAREFWRRIPWTD
jgi:paraquat-inducible protein A